MLTEKDVEMAEMSGDGAKGALGTNPVVEIKPPAVINCRFCVNVYTAAFLQSPVVVPLEET